MKPKPIIILEDSLEILSAQINYQNAILTVYNNEEAMILVNKEIGGTEKGVDIAALKANADFYRIRLTEIKTKQLEIGVKLDKLKKDKSRIQLQLNELNAKQNQPIGEIIIRVIANAAGNASFVTRYNVQNAGWAPMYDLRASDVDNPIKLTFKAGVYQNTGENWEKVKIKLSTANPNISNSKPVLNPWYLYYNNIISGTERRMNYSAGAPRAMNEASIDKAEYDDNKVQRL